MKKKLFGPSVLPASKKIKKIVLFLHGYGANGDDLISISDFWKDSIPNTIFISPHAPFKCDINPRGYQWFSLNERTKEELARGLKECKVYLDDFLNEILSKYQLRIQDLIVVGFSQGTILSLNYFTEKKESCAGIIGYSGLFYESEINSKFPILLYHGKDDQLIDHINSIRASENLKNKNFEVECIIRENLGHSIDHYGIEKGKNFLKKNFKV